MIRNDIDFNYLAQLYQSGISAAELGRRYHVKGETITKRFKKMGIPTRNREDVLKERRIEIDTDEIIQLYESGVAAKALARRFACDGTTIKQRLVESGVAIRGRSEAMYVRMANTPAEERTRLTAAAHSSVRGKSQTEEHLCKLAITRESRKRFVSRTEEILMQMLIDRGIACTPQKAFGRYNVDIALDKYPVVVEVFGGGWHSHGPHAARYAKRTKYLLDIGLDVIVIWVYGKSIPLEAGAADYIITVASELSRKESMRGEEHMIWGNGQSTSVGQCKFNNVPVIPSSECRDKVTGQFKPRPFDETMMM